MIQKPKHLSHAADFTQFDEIKIYFNMDTQLCIEKATGSSYPSGSRPAGKSSRKPNPGR